MLLNAVRFHAAACIDSAANLIEQKPEAKVAIAHDSEWCDHLPPVRMHPFFNTLQE